MHGDTSGESYTQELIDMLECLNPAHQGCREKGQAIFENLPRRAQEYVDEKREGPYRARRAELEWERRKAAGWTVGGDHYRATLEELLRTYALK